MKSFFFNPGTFTYRLNQTQLGLEYFGIYEDGRLFVTESLLTFTTGSSLTITATDKGDLEGKKHQQTLHIVITRREWFF